MDTVIFVEKKTDGRSKQLIDPALLLTMPALPVRKEKGIIAHPRSVHPARIPRILWSSYGWPVTHIHHFKRKKYRNEIELSEGMNRIFGIDGDTKSG